MQFCIHVHGIDLTERTKRHAYEKLELALDRLEQSVTCITVYLSDTNGPILGGIDKSCRIVVQIDNQESLILEDCDASVQVVIDRITDRLGVAASQRFESLHGKQMRIRRWMSYDDENLSKEGF